LTRIFVTLSSLGRSCPQVVPVPLSSSAIHPEDCYRCSIALFARRRYRQALQGALHHLHVCAHMKLKL
jgi:hypothetical protein